MKIFISCICGFVGSWLAKELVKAQSNNEVYGFDNYLRKGSHLNIDYYVNWEFQ